MGGWAAPLIGALFGVLVYVILFLWHRLRAKSMRLQEANREIERLQVRRLQDHERMMDYINDIQRIEALAGIAPDENEMAYVMQSLGVPLTQEQERRKSETSAVLDSILEDLEQLGPK